MTWNLFGSWSSGKPVRRQPVRLVLEDLENRRLLSAAITFPDPPPTMNPQWWVDADPAMAGIQRCRQITATAGATFQVTVVLNSVSGLHLFGYQLHFDSTYVAFQSAAVTDFTSSFVIGNSALTDPNTVAGQYSRPPGSGGVSSAAAVPILRLTFTVRAPYGQTGFRVDPQGSILLAEPSPGTLVPIPSDQGPGKAEAVMDPTAKAGCWTVTSTADDPDASPGDGLANALPDIPANYGKVKITLRSAIEAANALKFAVPKDIAFRVPDSGLACGVPCTIAPATKALPPVANPNGGTLLIDGTTQKGVVISGAMAPAGSDGFDITSPGNTIRGLTINGFSTGAGVAITAGPGNKIESDQIGTNVTGMAPVANGKGVVINGASGNLIGEAGAGNLISGNKTYGVVLMGVNTKNNKVQANLIGVDPTGKAGLANGSDGVVLLGPGPAASLTGNLIGGSLPAEANVIASNGGNGVQIAGPGASANLVQGNSVGTDAAGKGPLPNGGNGVRIDGTTGASGSAGNNLIGGIGAGNLIGPDGVLITGPGASNTKVLGNEINGTPGLMPVGCAPGGGNGIQLVNVDHVKIGGEYAGEGNTIRGFTACGVLVWGPNAHHNRVVNNEIRSNGADGVQVAAKANKNVIKENKLLANLNGIQIRDSGTTKNKVLANFIGSITQPNALDGVHVAAGATVNLVTGNSIGNNLGSGINITDSGTKGNLVTANLVLGNQAILGGVVIQGGASGNYIGGYILPARNDIIGNVGPGVAILGSSGNTVIGNCIGLTTPGCNVASPNGTAAAPQPGVRVTGPGNKIGEDKAGARNIISANTGAGIEIAGSAATGNRVQGNIIGLDGTGTMAADPAGNPLGNGSAGVVISGAGGNTIGGTTALARNVIAGNTGAGVLFTGAGATGNRVQGNYIGTDVTGTTSTDAAGFALGNGTDGVDVVGGAGTTTIGGTTTGAGNLISGNLGAGVLLSGTTGNLVQGNKIGTDVTGTTVSDAAGNPLGNGTDGIDVVGGAAANTIGGTVVGASNLLSGNLGAGVLLSGAGTTGNRVQGNKIGTDSTGTLTLGNGGDGIDLVNGAAGNTVGGTAAGAGNTIAFNGGVGVVVGSSAADTTTTGNGILGNAIFANALLGIDLGADGPTPNQPTNPAPGPNNWQNYPVLSSVTTSSSSGSTTIVGTLHSTPSMTFRLEFFSNPAADPSGYGQGQTYLGSTTVTTNSMGDVVPPFMVTFAVAIPGQCVAVTATDLGNNTSEFSLCVAATGTGPSGGARPGLRGTREDDAAWTGIIASFHSGDLAGPWASIVPPDARSSPTQGGLPASSLLSKWGLDVFFSGLERNLQADSLKPPSRFAGPWEPHCAGGLAWDFMLDQERDVLESLS